jgi:hypothetical protein
VIQRGVPIDAHEFAKLSIDRYKSLQKNKLDFIGTEYLLSEDFVQALKALAYCLPDKEPIHVVGEPSGNVTVRWTTGYDTAVLLKREIEKL